MAGRLLQKSPKNLLFFNPLFNINQRIKPIYLCLLLCAPSLLHAQEYGVGLGIGFHASNMVAYRLSFQKTAYYCPVRGYWQGTLNWVQSHGNRCANSFHGSGPFLVSNNILQRPHSCNGNLWGGSIAHVLSFSKRWPSLFFVPYGEVGLGGAIFNKSFVSDRRMGSNVLFEIIAGLGFRFGPCEQFDFGYKFIHFSNAYLARPNNGLNFNFVTFNYWFD